MDKRSFVNGLFVGLAGIAFLLFYSKMVDVSMAHFLAGSFLFIVGLHEASHGLKLCKCEMK